VVKIPLLDEGIAPDSFDYFLPFDEIPMLCEQDGKHLRRFWSEIEHLVSFPQDTFSIIESKFSEFVQINLTLRHTRELQSLHNFFLTFTGLFAGAQNKTFHREEARGISTHPMKQKREVHIRTEINEVWIVRSPRSSDPDLCPFCNGKPESSETVRSAGRQLIDYLMSPTADMEVIDPGDEIAALLEK
jgi:hypothetical protein